MYQDGKGLEVQIRTEIKKDWSFISAVAVQIGSNVIEVHSNGRYYIDGVEEVDIFRAKLSGHRMTWKSTRIHPGLNFELFTIYLENDAKIHVEVKNSLLD